MRNNSLRYTTPRPVHLTAPAAATRHTGLRRLVREYRARCQLLAIAQQALDSTSAQHLIGASLSGDTAFLTFDDANWLTRARYAQAQILSRLNAERPSTPVHRVRFLVRARPVASAGQQTSPRTVSRMTPGIGRVIRDASRGIQDPDLQQALFRLASRAHQ